MKRSSYEERVRLDYLEFSKKVSDDAELLLLNDFYEVIYELNSDGEGMEQEWTEKEDPFDADVNVIELSFSKFKDIIQDKTDINWESPETYVDYAMEAFNNI